MLTVAQILQVPGMGACLGLCRKKQRSRKICVPRCLYKTKSDRIEMELLVGNEIDILEELPDVWTTTDQLPALLLSENGKEAYEVEDTERLFSDFKYIDPLMRQSSLYLDAHALLANRAVGQVSASLESSTPPSSLELEWENEESFIPTSCRGSNKPKSLSSSVQEQSSGCEGESPESLEWDPCEEMSTDLETEQLLVEIEALTRRALQETGSWTVSK